MSRITKDGKARWTHTCEPCRAISTHPDHFRAIEAQQHHDKGFGHFDTVAGGIVRDTFRPILNLFGWTASADIEAIATRALWEGLK